MGIRPKPWTCGLLAHDADVTHSRYCSSRSFQGYGRIAVSLAPVVQVEDPVQQVEQGTSAGAGPGISAHARLVTSRDQSVLAHHFGGFVRDVLSNELDSNELDSAGRKRIVRWAAIEAISKQRGGAKLRADYHAITARRGKHKARVAVARRLLTLVYFGLRITRSAASTSPREASCSRPDASSLSPWRPLGARRECA